MTIDRSTRWDIRAPLFDPKGRFWNRVFRDKARYGDPTLAALRALDVHQVLLSDPLPMRRQVELLGRYMAREFRYDRLHFNEEAGPRGEAFLFTDRHSFSSDAAQSVGVCCFWWRTYSNHPPEWALAWVWLHPYVRSRGLLKAAWPHFLERFGDFLVEPPRSSAMRGFLAKHGSAAQQY